MAVKTQKQADTHKGFSKAKLKTGKTQEKQKVEKNENKKSTFPLEMCLPQAPKMEDYFCRVLYKGKIEEIKLKNGIIKAKDEQEYNKLLELGFEKLENKPVQDLGVFYCDEYLSKSFNLILDDKTTIPVVNGHTKPVSDWQVEQLLKRNFKLLKQLKNQNLYQMGE